MVTLKNYNYPIEKFIQQAEKQDGQCTVTPHQYEEYCMIYLQRLGHHS